MSFRLRRHGLRHPPRRGPSWRPEALLRVVVLALAATLLLAGCGGAAETTRDSAETPGRTQDDGPDKAGSDAPAPDPGFGVAEVGQCFRLSAAQSRASVANGRRVRCSAQHSSVVAFIGYLPRPVSPATPLAKRRALGKRLCEPAYRRLAGGTLADRATSILTWTLYTPGQSQLKRGARWVRCDVLARSGDKLVPLPPRAPLLESGVPEQLRVCQDADGVDISCGRRHAFRVEAVFRAVGGTYPAAPAYTPTARSRCQQLTKTYGGYWQPPSRAGWRSGDHFVRCLSVKATLPTS